MLLVILHLLKISNTHFTQISDVHSNFLPYLLSMMQITCLFVCLFLQNGYQKTTARVVPLCT